MGGNPALTLLTTENDVFLQHLRDLSLEEGRAYMRDHAAQISDYEAVAELIRG